MLKTNERMYHLHNPDNVMKVYCKKDRFMRIYCKKLLVSTEVIFVFVDILRVNALNTF